LSATDSRLSHHGWAPGQDLILLLSLVEDPRVLATEGALSRDERGWLRRVAKKLDFADPALADLIPLEELTRAEQAYRLLILDRS
jgi:hypothetical protein